MNAVESSEGSTFRSARGDLDWNWAKAPLERHLDGFIHSSSGLIQQLMGQAGIKRDPSGAKK